MRRAAFRNLLPRPAAAALAAAVGCQGAPADSGAQSRPTPAEARLPAPVPAAAVDASRRTAIVTAAARVAPAVVTVQTETVEQAPADPFDVFFGRRPGEQRRAGIGSGFFVRGDGVVLTNAHVVAGATTVSVALRDGTVYPARVLGADEANDLAVLKVDARNTRSFRAVERLGAQHDGTLRHHRLRTDGTVRDSAYFSVLADEWPQVRSGLVARLARTAPR